VPRSYWPNWGQHRASARRRCRPCGTTEPVRQRCASVPDPVAWIRPRHGDRPSSRSSSDSVDHSPRGCPPAEPTPNWDRPSGPEPSALRGRCGGTNALLGRGARPRSRRAALSGLGGRPLDKCLVQLRADARCGSPRCSQERSGQQRSGYNASEGEASSAVRGAPVDKRGHITPASHATPDGP